MLFWTSIGLGLFTFFSLMLFFNIGNKIDFRDLIIFVPVLQWIVGPWLSYTFLTDDVYYYMAVEQDDYMKFAVPSILLFSIGLYIPVKKVNIDFENGFDVIKQIVKRHKSLDLILIVVGIIFYFIEKSLPTQLRFIAFLLSNLRYVGLFFVFFSNRKSKNLIFYSVLGLTVLMSFKEAMFHLMLIWFLFLFFILAFIKKYYLVKKTLIVFALIISMIIIQSVKQEFRKIVWQGNLSDNVFSSFTSLVVEKIETEGALTHETNINNLISRINQGWIIARVMYYVPNFEPYAKGETIQNAIVATLVPRILATNKVTSGGKEYYTRFSGRELQPGTSMNISVLGEAYANYGQNGMWFMLAFGFFLNITYVFLLKLVKRNPSLLFFLPIIYLQVIKAETDFVTVLNHFVKASFLVWIIYFILRKFLKIKI